MTLDLFQSQTTISWLASHRVITHGPKPTHRSVLGTLLKNKTFSDTKRLLKRWQHLYSMHREHMQRKQKQATWMYFLMTGVFLNRQLFCRGSYPLLQRCITIRSILQGWPVGGLSEQPLTSVFQEKSLLKLSSTDDKPTNRFLIDLEQGTSLSL